MDREGCFVHQRPPPPTPFFSAKPSIPCTVLEGGGQCVLSPHNQDPHLQIKGSKSGEVLKSCLQLITVSAVSLPCREPEGGGSDRKFCGLIIIKPHVVMRDWILLCQLQMDGIPPASPSPLQPTLLSEPSSHPHPAPASAPIPIPILRFFPLFLVPGEVVGKHLFVL